MNETAVQPQPDRPVDRIRLLEPEPTAVRAAALAGVLLAPGVVPAAVAGMSTTDSVQCGR